MRKELRRPGKRLVAILAINVRRYRRSRGISQERLAELCGLHRTYVGSVERAERNVTLSTLEAIAQGLGISVSALITRKDDEHKRQG